MLFKIQFFIKRWTRKGLSKSFGPSSFYLGKSDRYLFSAWVLLGGRQVGSFIKISFSYKAMIALPLPLLPSSLPVSRLPHFLTSFPPSSFLFLLFSSFLPFIFPSQPFLHSFFPSYHPSLYFLSFCPYLPFFFLKHGLEMESFTFCSAKNPLPVNLSIVHRSQPQSPSE